MQANKVHISEIIGSRYNVSSYKSSISSLYKSISQSKYRLCKLRDVAGFQAGYAFKSKDYIPNSDCKLITIGNIYKNDIDVTNTVYLPSEYYETYYNFRISKGDVLIAMTGATIGKLGVYSSDDKALLNQRVGMFIPKEIDALYLMSLLDTEIYQKIIKNKAGGGAQPNISESELMSIEIPVPTIETQNEIVALYNKAQEEKKIKETQAQELLNSIDEYLLKELGINIINSEQKQFSFKVHISEMIGNKIDVKSNKNRENMKSSHIKEVLLKDIANIKKGQSITKDKIEYGNYPVIAGGQTSPYSSNVFNQEKNVITISSSGAYSGYVWYHDYEIFASDCMAIRSKDETKYLTKYIFEILKLKQNEIYKLQRGSGQPHVYAADISLISIPAITIEKQNEITKKITDIRYKAKQLKEEGETLLEQTKKEIENILIK